jgi:hypothetical protein
VGFLFFYEAAVLLRDGEEIAAAMDVALAHCFVSRHSYQSPTPPAEIGR